MKKKKNSFIIVMMTVAVICAGMIISPIIEKNRSTDENLNIPHIAEVGENNEEKAISPVEESKTYSQNQIIEEQASKQVFVKVSDVYEYSGSPYVFINNNVPEFSENELTTNAYETYSNLDNLGRAGTALAALGKETEPKDGEKRGSISKIKPTGWIQAQYDFVNGKSLYNRCHLIGWQLSAENANKSNLITGTRYLNVEGMLPFENMVADYIEETSNHVAYRVTPVYLNNNLVASGVQIEAKSVEDGGDGICFNIYCYNVQPGVVINYENGSSTAE